MELLSVDYGDFASLCDITPAEGSHSACLKLLISVDPALIVGDGLAQRTLDALTHIFPGVRGISPSDGSLESELETIAQLTGALILDLQRDLCEWPGGRTFLCQSTGDGYEYELYVESIDERVGRFSAQVAAQVMRMMLLEERFDPRLIWVIDLVRLLRRQPRLRLNAKRIAAQLGCSEGSARWAIQELERYGYVLTTRPRRRHRRVQSGRILVVDDSAQIRDLLSRILETLGYDVITAVDGEEGLILLGWADYRAVFVDLMMPCMDGFTFLKQARTQGLNCPTFVISAYEHRYTFQEIKDAGATDYVPKPFSISDIEAVLNRHLKRKVR
jgi:two-component system chemotaxis response regulator CheY